MVNRRQFLGSLAGALAAAPVDRRVLIAGARIAGLCCAWELNKRGYDVTVFEGRGRPGGRVETLGEGLAPGLTAEAGATRIPDTHHLTLGYVRQFGLGLEPFQPSGSADTFHVRGGNYTMQDGREPEWPLALTAVERSLGRLGLARQYLLPAVREARPEARSARIPASVAAADRGSLHEYLAAQGLSPAAIELVTLGFSPDISAGWMMLVEASSAIEKQFFHIRGGNDQLAAAFARDLAGKIHYGCRVVAFLQNDDQGSVVIERSGVRETWHAPHIVCTLPFSVTGGIFADARLPARKREPTADLPYLAASKVFLQMRRQFWRDRGLSGFAYTDLLSERFWVLGPPSADERGLLIGYLIGPKAARLDSLPEPDRIRATLEDAERVFPGARRHVEGAVLKSWAQDPWQRGAAPQLPPGKLGAISVCAEREGRIHFAGEHTSRWTGWIQGAIESAQRAVNEIAG